jgi:hypothetical protein
MTQRLSDILTVPLEFNFFKAVAHLEPFDLHRLELVIDEMLAYATRVSEILTQLQATDGRVDSHWLIEGKEKFYDMYRNIESIDSVVLQALNSLETNIQENQLGDATVFDKLDDLSQLSLDIKGGHLILLKSKIDVSIEYNDIYNLMMNSINNELEHCLKKCFKIHEKRFSSPVRHAPTFNLEILTKKLLQQRNQLRLPLLNEIDNELYEEYLELKTIVDPLKASLSFIPIRIDEFNTKYRDSNVADTKKITDKYQALVKEMQFLQNEVNDLKYELVDKRWSEIFSYLNTEMSFLITNVEKETVKMHNLDDGSNFKSQVFKRLKYTTDIVENTFILINQAIDEELIDFNTMERSNELAAQWLEVKNEIPQEYMARIDDEDSTTTNDRTINNFKKLSLEESKYKVSDNDTTRTVISDEDRSKKEKRKSMYGQFLFNKMNIQAVMIEGDPTSAKKPEDLNHHVKTSSINARSNGKMSSKAKETTINSTNIPDLKHSISGAIPELKNPLAIDIPDLKPHSLLSIPDSHTSISAAGSSARRGPFAQLTPIIDETPNKDIHEETMAHLLGGSPVDYETPAPRRCASNSSVVFAESKIPGPSPVFKSRIPRPMSRIHAHRPPSRSYAQRSSSSLGIRPSDRPNTSLALSRSKNDRLSVQLPPSAAQRHSVIPHTPVRSLNTSGKSLIPQPTPVREIIERGSSRLGSDRCSESTFSSRSSTALESRKEPPPRPVWR